MHKRLRGQVGFYGALQKSDSPLYTQNIQFHLLFKPKQKMQTFNAQEQP